MKASSNRFQEIALMFPALIGLIKKLDTAEIPYNIGGSVALYVQGGSRLPNDVDVMFTNEAHLKANALIGLNIEHIERPYVSMDKSSPVNDGSIDFLSTYTSVSDGRSFFTDPLEVIHVDFEDMVINLVPSEKIAVFKLVSRREHHNDLSDFYEIFNHPDFNTELFWKIADSLGARDTVTALLA